MGEGGRGRLGRGGGGWQGDMWVGRGGWWGGVGGGGGRLRGFAREAEVGRGGGC